GSILSHETSRWKRRCSGLTRVRGKGSRSRHRPVPSRGDSIDLLQQEDIWVRRRCRVADEARGESVSVGCDEGKRPGVDACAEVDLLVKGHGKSAKLRSSSRPAPLYDQEPAYHLATLDRRQRPSEGYLLACHRRGG